MSNSKGKNIKSVLNKLSIVIEQIRDCKLNKTCIELNESRQYFFEPNFNTIHEWQKQEKIYLQGIDTRVVFVAESPGGFAKGVIPTGFPTDGSILYRGWATVDRNPGIDNSKLKNNRKFKEFRDLAGLSNCFITNICKCGRIPKDRKSKTLTKEEINNCSIFLEKELHIINPLLVVAVGKKVNNYLNRLHFMYKYKIFPITHYSYYFGGKTAWDYWKRPGESGELDKLLFYLSKKISSYNSSLPQNKFINILHKQSERRIQSKERCDFPQNVKKSERFYPFFGKRGNSGENVEVQRDIKKIKDFLKGITQFPKFRQGTGLYYASRVILKSNMKDIHEAFEEYKPLHSQLRKPPQGKPNPKDRFLRNLSNWTESGGISIKKYIICFETILIKRLKSNQWEK